jgi:hypothetical protein
VVLGSFGLVSAARDLPGTTPAQPSSGGGLSASTDGRIAEVIRLRDRQVTVSWQVKATVPGVMLRLYRGGLDGDLVLLSELSTQPGVRSYQLRDVLDELSLWSYHLRVVGPSGRETELATLLCLLTQMKPATALPQTPSPDAVALATSTASFQLVRAWRPAQDDVSLRRSRPSPPTPPPRC